VRIHNLALVLRQIVRTQPAPSRADIASATGLTRATVSDLVQTLLDNRLVSERPAQASARAGRPAVPLAPASRTVFAVGAEINVDYMGVLVMDLTGQVLAERVIDGDHRTSDPAQVLPALDALCGEVLDDVVPRRGRLAGVCLALPGLVDDEIGVLRRAPNLGWRDIDVRALFAAHRRLRRVPVRLVNEANAAALAEAGALVAAGEHPSFLYVSADIGVGSAIVVDGQMMAGRHGWSGELGHTVLNPNGPRCGCGARGCLEQYAGKDALQRACGIARDEPLDTLLAALADGDRGCRAAVRDAGARLGVAIANAVNLVDVNQVVLGGIYVPLQQYVVPPIERALSRLVLSAPWVPCDVRPAVRGPRPALVGAAEAVLDRVLNDPSPWCAA
jgi:predicted NBD/HSP70 family sugar kinase